MIYQRHRQTDGQTDDMRSQRLHFALVHHTVKTDSLRSDVKLKLTG